MENYGDLLNDRKFANRTRSHNSAAALILKSEPSKRKSFNVNEAVRSLDLALCRLKKSKLVNGEHTTSRQMDPEAQDGTDMFMDTSSSYQPDNQNASLMSMNFSHYELVRNVSRPNCNSDGAHSGNAQSGNTCSAQSQLSAAVKDEHLERYFRSVEMWSRNFRDGPPSNLHLELMDQGQ